MDINLISASLTSAIFKTMSHEDRQTPTAKQLEKLEHSAEKEAVKTTFSRIW
jgi:hypothetical protein